MALHENHATFKSAYYMIFLHSVSVRPGHPSRSNLEVKSCHPERSERGVEHGCTGNGSEDEI